LRGRRNVYELFLVNRAMKSKNPAKTWPAAAGTHFSSRRCNVAVLASDACAASAGEIPRDSASKRRLRAKLSGRDPVRHLQQQKR